MLLPCNPWPHHGTAASTGDGQGGSKDTMFREALGNDNYRSGEHQTRPRTWVMEKNKTCSGSRGPRRPSPPAPVKTRRKKDCCHAALQVSQVIGPPLGQISGSATENPNISTKKQNTRFVIGSSMHMSMYGHRLVLV